MKGDKIVIKLRGLKQLFHCNVLFKLHFKFTNVRVRICKLTIIRKVGLHCWNDIFLQTRFTNQ